jgi:NAD(P)-dependent dehydrogenase (short-subunit alcohol dehydrogenase family)
MKADVVHVVAAPTRREPALLGQTVVVIGGSAGIGLETARRARAEGADVILTGRDHERLQGAASELGAQSTAAFDAKDPVRHQEEPIADCALVTPAADTFAGSSSVHGPIERQR